MENKTIKFISCITFVCLIQFVSFAQNSSIETFSKTLVTFSFLEKDMTTSLTTEKIKELKKSSSFPLDETLYRTLITSGFYYDRLEDRIYLNTVYDTKYSKVEIIEKHTNTHVYMHKFNEHLVEQEFNNLESGTYLIILSNDDGFIEVEELTIFQKNEQQVLAAQEIKE